MVGLLIAAVAAALASGYAVGQHSTIRSLRTELNSARANEQLLLTRLASRTPAEFHAVTAAAFGETPEPDGRTYLTDPTGILSFAVDDDGS